MGKNKTISIVGTHDDFDKIRNLLNQCLKCTVLNDSEFTEEDTVNVQKFIKLLKLPTMAKKKKVASEKTNSIITDRKKACPKCNSSKYICRKKKKWKKKK